MKSVMGFQTARKRMNSLGNNLEAGSRRWQPETDLQDRVAGSGSCWAISTISWVRGASHGGAVAAVSHSEKLAGSRILPFAFSNNAPRLKPEKATAHWPRSSAHLGRGG